MENSLDEDDDTFLLSCFVQLVDLGLPSSFVQYLFCFPPY